MSRPGLTAVPRAVRHFHHLAAADRARLFLAEPGEIRVDGDRELLATALGATLYIPADRPGLADTVLRRSAEGITSVVLDLEDAVRESGIEEATRNAVGALDELAAAGDPSTALVFLRARGMGCIPRIVELMSGTAADALTGFVIPKFDGRTAEAWLTQTADAATALGKHLYVMPVLESERILYRETRDAELETLSTALAEHRESVLAVRVGATDMCGALGIRRDRDHTIYDVRVVADVLADIVNRLGRRDGTGFVVTAPVWEYFADHERMFRPFLRATPFVEHRAVRFRDQLVSRDLDGLLREISLDRVNGMLGKTVIHPNHVAPVHALSVVTAEEYRDACAIVGADAGGVLRSDYRNKMNEARPHAIWARQVLRRAEVFGVANDGVTFVDLLVALAGLG